MAEGFALGWYVGNGDDAATERWAFAFSAKRDWKPKFESDVAKIVGTERGYTQAFFVSNQYISDKARAKAEDALQKEHRIAIRIFDRSWILDRVFEGRLEQLAVDELGLHTSTRREVRKGPKDTDRERDFDRVEARVQASLAGGRRDPAVVDDCLEAADLARGLERPRVEVDGLYGRADRLAMKFGTLHQQIEVAYEHAWTTYWWYEDYDQFAQLYAEVERRAKGSRNAYELELWLNLFYLLHTTAAAGHFGPEIANLKARAATLTKELGRLAQERYRPSTALQARTLGLLLKLLLKRDSATHVNRILRELKRVVQESGGLVGYPLESTTQLLTEMGAVFGSHEAYEDLFDTVVETATARRGAVSAAQILLTRGAQQMDAEHHYEAIRTLGRALGKLYKHESRHDAVHALYLCAIAYERVGLLWAARGTMLAAASVATNEYWTYGTTTPQQAVCYNGLKWIELRLGRLAHLLAWHDLDRALRAALVARGYDSNRLDADDCSFDAILGILLLRTDLWELNTLTRMPDALEALGLPLAALALKYALGHEGEVPPELLGGQEGAESMVDIFRQWRDQPAATGVPHAPLLYNTRTVTLKSNVLGCHISVDSAIAVPCVDLAETVLAALEGLLATGVLERIVAREPTLTVNVRPSDFAEEPFGFEITHLHGRPHIDIRCRSFSPHSLTSEEQSQVKKQLSELLMRLIGHVFMIDDPERLLRRLLREDLALQRALDFTTSFVVVGNVLGHQPHTLLRAWTRGDLRLYAVTRSVPWDSDDRRSTADAPTPPSLTMGDPSAAPPPELIDAKPASHDQMETVSIIRESLWNQAGWIGVGFATALGEERIPAMALIFKNGSVAHDIFSLWHAELGAKGRQNRLRVAIIRGISRANPAAYRVILGSDPGPSLTRPGVKQAVAVSRVHTMEPSSDENLQRFLASYAAHGEYFLAYGHAKGDTVSFSDEHRLLQRELVVRDAWRVDQNDLDLVAIRSSDDPIIPPGTKDVPILRVLGAKRRRK